MSDESANEVAVFGFEKLDVYRCSVEFLALARQLGEALPRGQSALALSCCKSSACCPSSVAHADADADVDGGTPER